MKKTLRVTVTKLIPKVLIEEQYWRASLLQELAQPSSSIIAKGFKGLCLKEW